MTGATVVGLYFYRLSGAGGGAERMLCQLANALALRDFDVHLISWDAENATAFYPIDPAVHWIKLGFKPGRLDKFRRIRAFHSVLRWYKIQALVGFVMSGDRTVYAATKLAGVKLIVAERNAPEMYRFRYGPLQRWLTFRLLGLADCITVQMENYSAGYPRRLKERIVTIPNPVAATNCYATPDVANAAGRYTLLAVSRLDPIQKQIGCLMCAFASISEKLPEWDLCIIGDGPEEAALHLLIEECGLADRIRIESSTPDVFDAYVRSHLFAIPSRWEGFPNALAEAMSHGLPAVGFANAAGVAELIGPEGGWLAEGLDDEEALAAMLATAMADGEERLRRGRSGARRMSQFTPERQFDRWADLLSALTKDRTL